MTYVEKLLDVLDAEVFSGDSFHDKENLENLKYHLHRWTNAVPRIERIIKDSETEIDHD